MRQIGSVTVRVPRTQAANKQNATQKMPRAKRFALAPGVDVVLIAMKAALRRWALQTGAPSRLRHGCQSGRSSDRFRFIFFPQQSGESNSSSYSSRVLMIMNLRKESGRLKGRFEIPQSCFRIGEKKIHSEKPCCVDQQHFVLQNVSIRSKAT